MTTFKLHHIWKKVLAQWMPELCATRRTNLIWLIIGLYLGGRVQASAIVKHWPVAVQVSSLTRRLSRFLSNAAVQTSQWYQPVARSLLAGATQRRLTLIIDASKIGAHQQLVIVALAYHHRALPLAWGWVPYRQGMVAFRTTRQVCAQVQALLPPAGQVTLVGDAGFSSVALLQQLTDWGWRYVLRHEGRVLCQRPGQTSWERLDHLVTRPGQRVWLPHVTLTAQHQQPTALLAIWEVGYTRPWLLSTNLPTAPAARRAYAQRMWIEEMFGDWKGHGWDIESTHLRHPDRLARLVLAVALLYVWLVLWGRRLIRAGCRAWVDRHNRRDLSLFRIGLDTLQRCCTLLKPPPIPTPSLVGGPSVR
jgi:hypothetical protein